MQRARRGWTVGDVAGAAGAIALTAAAAAVGGATGDFRSEWYQRLRKPAWQPSGRTIGAAWSLLYPMIGIAGALLWTRRRVPGARAVYVLFGAQLALNAAWTPIFTRARLVRAAAAECGVLTGVNVALVARSWRVHRGAAALLIPYTAWTGFATILTAAVARLNP